MAKIVWNTGRPPHIGWWNASINYNQNVWRWWNGKRWSASCTALDSGAAAAHRAALPAWYSTREIRWNDSWPVRARVPRINPRSSKITHT